MHSGFCHLVPQYRQHLIVRLVYLEHQGCLDKGYLWKNHYLYSKTFIFTFIGTDLLV